MLNVTRLVAGKHVPAPLMGVMKRLEGMFGNDLQMTTLDSNAVTVRVRSLTNEVLIRTLMVRKDAIFGSGPLMGSGCVLGPSDFEILCPLATVPDGGLTIRYLRNLPNRDEYLSGFWYV